MFLQFVLLIIFVALYALGGQGYRWTKKWVGPSIFGLGQLLTHPFGIILLMGSVGYLGASNSFSYGEKWTQGKLWKKLLFRGLSGLMYGICGFLIGISGGHWILGSLQLALAPVVSMIFGVFNPFGSKLGNWSTVLEDIFISLGFIILIPFMVH